MKTCYVAAPFIFDSENTLRHDIRSAALGDEHLLRYPSSPPSVIEFCGAPYSYIGPFWYEETEGGVFTDFDSADVVRAEKKLIDRADLFIAIFDGTFAPGTAAELVYAATLGKDVAVVFLPIMCIRRTRRASVRCRTPARRRISVFDTRTPSPSPGMAASIWASIRSRRTSSNHRASFPSAYRRIAPSFPGNTLSCQHMRKVIYSYGRYTGRKFARQESAYDR